MATLRCDGQLVIDSPENKTLTLSATAEGGIAFRAGQTRDFLPLLRAMHARKQLGTPALVALGHTGLVTKVVAAGRVIAVLGERGNWLGRLLGLPMVRIHLLSALRSF